MSVASRLRARWETSSQSSRDDRDERPRPPSGDAMAVEHLTTAMGCAH